MIIEKRKERKSWCPRKDREKKKGYVTDGY